MRIADCRLISIETEWPVLFNPQSEICNPQLFPEAENALTHPSLRCSMPPLCRPRRIPGRAAEVVAGPRRAAAGMSVDGGVNVRLSWPLHD